MALKQYNPTSSARRGLILVDKSALWKGKPVKALTEGKRKTGGRNNKGHVTSRGIAGGHKQKYRYIDFKRRTWDVPATVERLEYDPNRSAFIALVTYEGGEQAYIIAPQRLAPGEPGVVHAGVDDDVVAARPHRRREAERGDGAGRWRRTRVGRAVAASGGGASGDEEQHADAAGGAGAHGRGAWAPCPVQSRTYRAGWATPGTCNVSMPVICPLPRSTVTRTGNLPGPRSKVSCRIPGANSWLEISVASVTLEDRFT